MEEGEEENEEEEEKKTSGVITRLFSYKKRFITKPLGISLTSLYKVIPKKRQVFYVGT